MINPTKTNEPIGAGAGAGTATTTFGRYCKIKTIKASPSNSGKGATSPLTNTTGTSMNQKKKQLKIERKMQMEQRNRHHRFMLRMVLLFYFMIVTTIVVFYAMSKPQQFYFIWSSASLANNLKHSTMKDLLLLQQRKPPPSVLSYGNVQDVEEFVEVSVPHSTPAATAATTKKSMVVEETRIPVRTTETLDQTKPLPTFSFQVGEILGVSFIQCSTIHGWHGVPPAASSSSSPTTDIQMPQSSYSNDVIFLGRQFFRDNDFFNSALKPGSDVPLHIDTEIGLRAIYDYCRTAEEQVGYVDSVIALDVDHTTSTVHIVELLQELLRVQRISALPVAAIVTPERSSQTILDWIMYGDRYELMNRVTRHWIPISAGPYMLQAIADDQYDGDATTVTTGSKTTDEFTSKQNNHTNKDVPGDSRSDIAPSMSLPSSSIFRQIDPWPMLIISGIEDMISQEAGPLFRGTTRMTDRPPSHPVTTTKYTILPGNTTCYLSHASLVMVTILDYLKDWDRHHPMVDRPGH